MKTNFAHVREHSLIGRLKTSADGTAIRSRETESPANLDSDVFLDKICRRMRPQDTPRRSRSERRRRPSVLLVEDDPCNRELIEDIFRYDGIPADLVTAASAEESLITVPTLKPMLILMDLQLPGMNGIQATRLLKKNPLTEHIPVWAVTCLSQREDIERGLEAGCDGYVTKPLRRSEFVFRLLSLWEDPIDREFRDTDFDIDPGSDNWIG